MGIADDGTVEDITARREFFDRIRISPDGRRAAVVIVELADDDSRRVDRALWLLDLGRDTYSRVTAGIATDPVWSADGEWIYFAQDHETNGRDSWRRRSDFSGPPEPVLEREGNQRPTDATPDGTRLLFDDGNDVTVLDLETGEETPWVATEDREYNARVSPDGRLVAYVSNESGTAQVYVRELDGGRRWAISPERGVSPAWDPDELRLYYTAGDRGAERMASVAMTFDDDLEVLPEQIFDAAPDGITTLHEFTPDGRLIMALPVSGDEETASTPAHGRIFLRLNWFQELERLVPEER